MSRFPAFDHDRKPHVEVIDGVPTICNDRELVAELAVIEPLDERTDEFVLRDGEIRQYDPNGFGAYRRFTLDEARILVPALASLLAVADAAECPAMMLPPRCSLADPASFWDEETALINPPAGAGFPNLECTCPHWTTTCPAHAAHEPGCICGREGTCSTPEADPKEMRRQLAALVDRYYRGTDPDTRTRLENLAGLLRSMAAANLEVSREIAHYLTEAEDADTKRREAEDARDAALERVEDLEAEVRALGGPQ